MNRFGTAWCSDGLSRADTRIDSLREGKRSRRVDSGPPLHICVRISGKVEGRRNVQEILGSHNDDDAFDAFLKNWRVIANHRIAQAIDVISRVDGVAGLILAGSHGAGNPWPLSDIDLLPIYRDDQIDGAIEAVERNRLVMLDEWSTQGWRTGLDIGRLRFTTGELRRGFMSGEPDLVSLLTDERWYHSIDKGFGGRAVFDPDGLAGPLARWFTRHRFDPEVVAERLGRSATSAMQCLQDVDAHLASGRRDLAFGQLLKAVQWYQIHLMEGWGERDNSLGRFGTRFDLTASHQGKASLVADLNALSGLDETAVRRRLDRAPRWVIERRDRSWAARRHIGEQVTPLQNDQDVLRVSTMYELRTVTGPPYPFWLAVPDSDDDLLQRVQRLTGSIPVRNRR